MVEQTHILVNNSDLKPTWRAYGAREMIEKEQCGNNKP